MAKPTFSTGDVPTATQVNAWFVNVTAAVKTATESVTSSTALQDDDTLSVSVDANTTYHFQAMLKYDAATAGDLKFRWTVPASATLSFSLQRLHDAAALFTDDQAFGGANDSDITAGGLGAGTTCWLPMQGILTVSSTAGTLLLRWAQNTSSATATRLFADSYVFLQRVA